METIQPQIVVKGIYSPEAYKEAVDKVKMDLSILQKEAVKKMSIAFGISGSDIVKALKYYAYDRNITLTKSKD